MTQPTEDKNKNYGIPDFARIESQQEQFQGNRDIKLQSQILLENAELKQDLVGKNRTIEAFLIALKANSIEQGKQNLTEILTELAAIKAENVSLNRKLKATEKQKK